ncbi:MAG: glutaredoxin family protein [Gammaproteobacteria bacterium]|nr:glutaredoxin family protein [Gammaproteobacteria bacterium]
MYQLVSPYQFSHKIAIEMVNIDTHQVLQEKYGLLIPVLTDCSDNEICHYFFDKAAFEQLLDSNSC